MILDNFKISLIKIILIIYFCVIFKAFKAQEPCAPCSSEFCNDTSIYAGFLVQNYISKNRWFNNNF